MSSLLKDKATICIVNYKTLELTKLCLRSIRKFTRYPYEVIVVDNNSCDESLEFLKLLNWINLIERRPGVKEFGGDFAHGAGLDLGLMECNTEFFISMHSDTIIKKENWLADLIDYFSGNENIACVGSGKIELKPKWQIFLQKVTDLNALKRKLFNDAESLLRFRYHNRTICCLYRTDVLRREHLSFLMNKSQSLAVGQKLYFELVDRGYKTVELPASIMSQYVIHLAHATQAKNPQEFNLHKKTIRKYNRYVTKIMSTDSAQSILMDYSLDQ